MSPFVVLACIALTVFGLTLGLMLRKRGLSNKAGYTMLVVANLIGVGLIPGMEYPRNIVLAALVTASMAVMLFKLLNTDRIDSSGPDSKQHDEKD